MIYELAHVIKDRCAILWDCMEWGNSLAFSIRYGRNLEHLDEIVNEGVVEPYEMRVAGKRDVSVLHTFFFRQPESSFRFFTPPHGFDEDTLRTLVGRKSFLTFVLVKHGDAGEEIVGYAFMRCFVNGSSYRGYMVDADYRGRGLAQVIGSGLNRVGDALHLKMYKSISPENSASMRAIQKVCDTEILRKLDNGDYLIKCMSKQMNTDFNNMGGVVCLSEVNQGFMSQKEWLYAA